MTSPSDGLARVLDTGDESTANNVLRFPRPYVEPPTMQRLRDEHADRRGRIRAGRAEAVERQHSSASARRASG